MNQPVSSKYQPMNKVEFFYEGYRFLIEEYGYGGDLFKSWISLPDGSLHFVEYNVFAETWEQCLFETMENCRWITSDYGVSPIGFDPTWVTPVNPEDIF